MASMRVTPFDLIPEARHQSGLKLQFVVRAETSIITPDQPPHFPQNNNVKLCSFSSIKNHVLPLTGSVGRMAFCLYPALVQVIPDI